MRFISSALFIFFLSILAAGQTEKLLDILKPDAASIAEAQRMDAKVFKLLPHKMFYEWPEPKSLKDEDYKIGIRGGGSFYSFTTGSHSYNSLPEISLSDKRLAVESYQGFFVDLGKRDLSTIDLTSAEAERVLAYKLPKFWKDLPDENLKVYKGLVDGPLTFKHFAYPSQGNSYLIRAITVEKADITVAFEILAIGQDGSMTIAWKKLAELPPTLALYVPDEVLQTTVDTIITEEHLVCDRVIVKDNHLYFLVAPTDQSKKDNSLLEKILKDRRIQYRGSGGELPNK